jgi:hypothetical protein
MRVFLTVGLLAACVAGSGCRPDDEAGSGTGSGSEILFRYQFAGANAVARDDHGTQLKKIAALDRTRALFEQTLDRAARSPDTLAPGMLTAQQLEEGAALVRPLLEDCIRFESFVELRSSASGNAEWLLGVALPPDRIPAWSAGLEGLGRLWNLGEPGPWSDDRNTGGIRRTHWPENIRWAAVGRWFLVGLGDDVPVRLDQRLASIRETGRPVPALSNAWLTMEADLKRLAGAIGLSSRMIWPKATLSVVGREEDLRTTMRLLFHEPVTGPLRPWQAPTNIATEPLVSFAAARGIGPLLDRWDVFRTLELAPAPGQVYVWAQELVPFQTFLAVPIEDPTNRIERIARVAPGLFDEEWRKQGLAQIAWDAGQHQAIWRGLLMVTPYLRPARDAGRPFMVGGLWPPVRTTNPPPAELLAQFMPRSDVLYYGWELTQVRLNQWRNMAQLMAVIAGDPQLSTNTAGLNWLLQVEPHLGNTTTEITLVSPREWSLVRRSHVGLSAVELVTLVRWLESVDFPKPGLRLPPAPVRGPAPTDATAGPSTSP